MHDRRRRRITNEIIDTSNYKKHNFNPWNIQRSNKNCKQTFSCHTRIKLNCFTKLYSLILQHLYLPVLVMTYKSDLNQSLGSASQWLKWPKSFNKVWLSQVFQGLTKVTSHFGRYFTCKMNIGHYKFNITLTYQHIISYTHSNLFIQFNMLSYEIDLMHTSLRQMKIPCK